MTHKGHNNLIEHMRTLESFIITKYVCNTTSNLSLIIVRVREQIIIGLQSLSAEIFVINGTILI